MTISIASSKLPLRLLLDTSQQDQRKCWWGFYSVWVYGVLNGVLSSHHVVFKRYHWDCCRPGQPTGLPWWNHDKTPTGEENSKSQQIRNIMFPRSISSQAVRRRTQRPRPTNQQKTKNTYAKNAKWLTSMSCEFGRCHILHSLSNVWWATRNDSTYVYIYKYMYTNLWTTNVELHSKWLTSPFRSQTTECEIVFFPATHGASLQNVKYIQILYIYIPIISHIIDYIYHR